MKSFLSSLTLHINPDAWGNLFYQLESSDIFQMGCHQKMGEICLKKSNCQTVVSECMKNVARNISQ